MQWQMLLLNETHERWKTDFLSSHVILRSLPETMPRLCDLCISCQNAARFIAVSESGMTWKHRPNPLFSRMIVATTLAWATVLQQA
jgi:hypothetical protein